MENNDLNCYFQPSWEMTSIDQTATDPFESALSSMVSSPTAASNGPDFIPGDGMMIRELIGRLGSICDSGEISPIGTGNNSTNTSCYSTPLNSPPKRFNLGSLIQMQDGNFPNYPSNLGSLNADPGFVERAAKFSCFGNGGGFGGGEMGIKNLEMKAGKLSRVSSNLSVKNGTANENGDSGEGSSVSQNDANSKKRKSIPKANVKDSAAKIDKVEAEKEKSNAKRSKKEDEVGKKENAGDSKNNNSNNSNDNANQKQNNDKNNNTENKEKEASKPEPPKDYIHVRARRGQATDSHSLAERVRREKISERMKFLQDLVPGCNKVTGKATVLDEIINYVQSLQRQVEFLSMKLATVNPRMEFNMDALLSSKDVFSTNGSPLAQTMYQVDQTSTQAFPLGYHQASQQLPLPIFANSGPNGINENSLSLNPLNNAGIRRNPSLQLPSIHGFVDSMTQMSNFWEDDLQSIVQMGLAQNQTPSIAGKLPNATQMKAEL